MFYAQAFFANIFFVINLQKLFFTLVNRGTICTHDIYSVTLLNYLWWGIWHRRTHMDWSGQMVLQSYPHCLRPKATDLSSLQISSFAVLCLRNQIKSWTLRWTLRFFIVWWKQCNTAAFRHGRRGCSGDRKMWLLWNILSYPIKWRPSKLETSMLKRRFKKWQ